MKAAADARESSIRKLKPHLSGIRLPTEDADYDPIPSGGLKVREKPAKPLVSGATVIQKDAEQPCVSPDEGPPLPLPVGAQERVPCVAEADGDIDDSGGPAVQVVDCLEGHSNLV